MLRLKLNQVHVADSVLNDLLKRHSNLTSLSIKGSVPLQVPHLDFPRLRRLDLGQCRALSPSWITPNLPSLTALDLSRTTVADYDLAEFLAKLQAPLLSSIRLVGCKNLKHTFAAPDAPLASRLSLGNLLDVNLSNSTINGHFLMELLALAPRLQRVDVSYCPFLERPLIEHVRSGCCVPQYYVVSLTLSCSVHGDGSYVPCFYRRRCWSSTPTDATGWCCRGLLARRCKRWCSASPRCPTTA